MSFCKFSLINKSYLVEGCYCRKPDIRYGLLSASSLQPGLNTTDKRGGVWREKHHFDSGMKITNKRRVSGGIIKNKQNLEKYVIIETALCIYIYIYIYI